jgi:soluble lytic murein transglycosylase-like protein
MELILQWIVEYSAIYGVDTRLALAVAQVESGLNPHAVSNKQAQGIYQLMPSSFPGYSINQLRDPETNIKLGIEYLSLMKKTCVHQDNNTWLICYNFGSENAKKVKYPSKFPYVKKVNQIMRSY